MKINILDAGLVARQGHHFDFDRKLLVELARAGHEVRVYGFSGMDEAAVEDLRPHGEVTPLFRVPQYGGLEPFDRYAGEIDVFLRKSAIFAEDLRAVADADLWIWPTMRPYNLHACTLSGTGAAVAGCIHKDPGVAARTVGAMLWRVAFLAAQRSGLRHTVGSIEPELRERFVPIIPDGRFLHLPQPFDGPPIAEPKSRVGRIGFLGEQRRDKGGEILGALLTRLVAEGHAITFHNSNPRFRPPVHPQIELLEFVEDFAVPVAACDLVVLPYQPHEYTTKGSGLLAQCLALGIPVVGPADTLPGRIIAQYGIGPLFDVATAEAIHGAIKLAERDFAEYAGNALRAAHEWGPHNGAAAFAKAFLSVME